MTEQAYFCAHCEVDRSRIDLAALNTITYGLYVVTAREGEKRNGCIVNTVVQVAGEPCQVSVSVSKANLTHDFIVRTGQFAVSVLEQDTPLQFIGTFGFRSGRDYDKFAHAGYRDGLNGCPLLTENTLSTIEGKVRTAVDCGSHTTFFADVVTSQVVKTGKPLTYEYYHTVKGGKTGRNAPTYAASMAAAGIVDQERNKRS
jgi:flavin reductase (DIM6/NTAB) family NADH-FMN oxidoreductase RutF